LQSLSGRAAGRRLVVVGRGSADGPRARNHPVGL
jgi:hypothetical protein